MVQIVYENPKLYGSGIRNEFFNTRVFWISNINAIVDSVILSYFPVYQLGHFSEDGVFETFLQAGALTYTAVILVANIRVALLQYQWYWLNFLILFLSVASWFLIGWSVSNLIDVDYNWYNLFDRLLGAESFWLSLIWCVSIVLIKDITLLHTKNQLSPTNVQIMTEISSYGTTIVEKWVEEDKIHVELKER